MAGTPLTALHLTGFSHPHLRPAMVNWRPLRYIRVMLSYVTVKKRSSGEGRRERVVRGRWRRGIGVRVASERSGWTDVLTCDEM